MPLTSEEALVAAEAADRWEGSGFNWYESCAARVMSSPRVHVNLLEYGSPEIAVAAHRGDDYARLSLYLVAHALEFRDCDMYCDELSVNPRGIASALREYAESFAVVGVE